MGETLAIGAPGEDGAGATGGDQTDNTADGAGAVYVYTRAGTSWSLTQYVKHPSADTLDGFGGSVSVERGMLLVGVQNDDGSDSGLSGDPSDNGWNEAGAACFYALDAGGWTFRTYIKSSNGYRGDRLGQSTAIGADGAVLAVSTIDEASDQTGPNPPVVNDLAPLSGAVYLYR